MIPFRKPNGSYKSRADLAVDGEFNEYGIPLCEHCGAPGTMVGKELGFRVRNGEPVILFRCTLPGDRVECKKIQTRHCRDEWLLFGPLTREEPLYFELSGAGKPGEKNNALDRRRYMLAGADPDTRAKRIGTSFLDLRAALGAFLDIFRVLLRRVGSSRTPRRTRGRRCAATARRRSRRSAGGCAGSGCCCRAGRRRRSSVLPSPARSLTAGFPSASGSRSRRRQLPRNARS